MTRAERTALRKALGAHAKAVLPALLALVDGHRRLLDGTSAPADSRAKVRAARAVGRASVTLQCALDKAARRGVMLGLADFPIGKRTLRIWLRDLDGLARWAATARPRGRRYQTDRLWLAVQIAALLREHAVPATKARTGCLARILTIVLPIAGESAPRDPLRLITHAVTCFDRLSR